MDPTLRYEAEQPPMAEAQRKTSNIDDRISFIFKQIAICDFKIIFIHSYIILFLKLATAGAGFPAFTGFRSLRSQ